MDAALPTAAAVKLTASQATKPMICLCVGKVMIQPSESLTSKSSQEPERLQLERNIRHCPRAPRLESWLAGVYERRGGPLPAGGGDRRLALDDLKDQRRLAPGGPALDLFFHHFAHRCLLWRVVTLEQVFSGSLHPCAAKNPHRRPACGRFRMIVLVQKLRLSEA